MKHIIFVSLALTLLAACTSAPQTTPTPESVPTPPVESMTQEDSSMTEKDTMTGEVESTDGPGEVTPEAMAEVRAELTAESKVLVPVVMEKSDTAGDKLSGYVSYDAAMVDETLASGQKVVLFFHATWCPSCKTLDAAIESDLASIPADTLIVKVDYDTSTELKKKYRVVGQHTTVVLNADGSEKSKKLGARTVAEILN